VSDPRRLIDDATTGSLRRTLLQAGRDAAPSAGAKQALLESLAHGVSTGGALGSTGTVAGKVTVSAWKAAGLGKWLAVSVIGAVATGGILHLATHEPAPSSESAALVAHEVASEASASAGSTARQPGALAGTPTATDDGADAPTLPAEPAPALDSSTRAPQHARARARQRARRMVSAEPVRPTSEAEHDSAEAASTHASADGSKALGASPGEAPQTLHERVEGRLREELELLDDARRALRAGDHGAARRRLQSYWQRFPSGYLAREARRLDASVHHED
jgi:hypothetical protein